MVKRRSIFYDLPETYLFPEINRRKTLFLEQNPSVSLIDLGVGDTVKPLPLYVAEKLQKAAISMSMEKSYQGYGEAQGMAQLREKICNRFYGDHIEIDEVFISDGAKCDIGRLQMLFGGEIKVAIQDPAYPVYFEGSLLQGIKTITLMPCLPENNFFPDFLNLAQHDLIYICHPNNPTGSTYTFKQLQILVDYAIEHHTIILFDVAYASFIEDPSLPSTIYEIPGAEKVAIEVGSFSKMAGFSGMRLGWTVVPKTLCFEDGYQIWKDWKRMNMTIYNGASTVVQQGGLAVLEEEGWTQITDILNQYKKNASHLRQGFEKLGFTVYGGNHSPYLWISCSQRGSWDVFQEFLEKKHLIVIPGKGFGPSGEHFIRVSAFIQDHQIPEVLNLL